jgi:hypothetical protein
MAITIPIQDQLYDDVNSLWKITAFFKNIIADVWIVIEEEETCEV